MMDEMIGIPNGQRQGLELLGRHHPAGWECSFVAASAAPGHAMEDCVVGGGG